MTACGQGDSHLNCLRQPGRGCGRRPARAKIRPMRARVEATCQVKLPLASVATGRRIGTASNARWAREIAPSYGCTIS